MKDFDWTGERLTTSKRNEIMIHHLHRYALAMDLVSGLNVLDIASGEGYGSSLLASKAKSVVGVDIDKSVVEFATQKYKQENVSFLEGSTSNIPCKDAIFDAIVSFETIEHHDEHDQMMKEFKRVLKPNGFIIISSPDKYHYTDLTTFNNPFHVKELYQKEFKELINVYFKHTIHLNQNIYYNSVIVSDTPTNSAFLEYQGDYSDIKSYPTLSAPMYNICIASDRQLDASIQGLTSVFNSPELLSDLKNKEIEIYNSKTYKAGMFVTSPYRLFKRLINK